MIIRRRRNSRYTVIPNEIASDDRLSIEARWLLFYLLTKPDNWEVRIPDIQAAGKIGRDKSYRIVKECEEAGYIDRAPVRSPKGKILGYDYVVRDEPEQKNPVPENQETASEIRDRHVRHPENPYPAQPDTANQEHNNKGKIPITEGVVVGGPSPNALFARLAEAGGDAIDHRAQKIQLVTIPERWLEQGFDLERDIIPVIQVQAAQAVSRGDLISSWAYFTAAIHRQHRERTAPMPKGAGLIVGTGQPARDPYASRINEDRMNALLTEIDGEADKIGTEQ